MPLARLTVDPSNEAMHAAGDALAADEEAFRKSFDTGDVLLVGARATDLLAAPRLAELRRLGDGLAALQGVRLVLEPTRAVQVVPGPLGFGVEPLVGDLDGGKPLDPVLLAARIRSNPLVRDLLIGPDLDTALLVVHLAPRGSPDWVRRDTIVARVREVSHACPSLEVHLAGSAVEEIAVGRAVRHDQALFLPVVVVLLAGILAAAFRSLRGVVLPLGVVGSSLVATLGLYGLYGRELNAVTSLLTPVVLVVATSVAVHLISGYLAALRTGAASLPAAARAMQELVVPCLLTTATTAVGFLALRTSPIPAVRDFGTFAAAGVGVSLLSAFLLIPPVLSRLAIPRERVRGVGGAAREFLPSVLVWIANRVVRFRGTILVVALATFAAAAWSARSIVVNTDLKAALGPGSELACAARFFDRHLGGAGVIECLVRAADGRLDAPAEMTAVARLEAELERDPEVTRAVSAVDLIAAMFRAGEGEGDSRAGVPGDPKVLDVYVAMLLASNREEVRHAMTRDGSALRLTLRVRPTASRRVEALLDRIEKIRARVAPGLDVRPTGSLVRVATDSNALARAQLRSVAAAFAVILAMIGVLFRSLRAAIVALVPNAIPILWTYGLMGAAGVELSSATSMIACVAIGLVVDNTIHLLARFLRSHRDGEAYAEAVRKGLGGTGVAVLISTAALVGGFSVGAVSAFVPTMQFSLLTGLTLVFALACDVIVLPACLPLVFRRFRA